MPRTKFSFGAVETLLDDSEILPNDAEEEVSKIQRREAPVEETRSVDQSHSTQPLVNDEHHNLNLQRQKRKRNDNEDPQNRSTHDRIRNQRAQSRDLMPPPAAVSRFSELRTDHQEVPETPQTGDARNPWKAAAQPQVKLHQNGTWQNPELIQSHSPISTNRRAATDNKTMSGALSASSKPIYTDSLENPELSTHVNFRRKARASVPFLVPLDSVATKYNADQAGPPLASSLPFMGRERQEMGMRRDSNADGISRDLRNTNPYNKGSLLQEQGHDDEVQIIGERRIPQVYEQAQPLRNPRNFQLGASVPSTPSFPRNQRFDNVAPQPNPSPFFSRQGTQLVTPARSRLHSHQARATPHGRFQNRIQPLGSMTLYPNRVAHNSVSSPITPSHHQAYRRQQVGSRGATAYGIASSPPYSGQSNGLRPVRDSNGFFRQPVEPNYSHTGQSTPNRVSGRPMYVESLPSPMPSYAPKAPTRQIVGRPPRNRSREPIIGARIGSSLFAGSKRSKAAGGLGQQMFRGISSGYAFPDDNCIRRDRL